MKKRFQHAGIGGTFDHLHEGHKLLLDTTFSSAQKVSIGITTLELISSKPLAKSIQTYDDRKAGIINYLKTHNYLPRANIFPLTDIYGIAQSDPTVDLLVVTKESYPNALKINQERKKRGYLIAEIHTIPFVKGKDNKIISSRRIRTGLIDRYGKKYTSFFHKNVLALPKQFRSELRKPLGLVIEGTENNLAEAASKAHSYIRSRDYQLIITIGDVVTKTLIETSLIPDIAVIDFKTQRHTDIQHGHIHSKSTSILNKPGTINKKVVNRLLSVINQCLLTPLKSTHTIVIKGEEDLTALIAVILAPLNSIVMYGQVGKGIIVIEVNEDVKKKVSTIISKFT